MVTDSIALNSICIGRSRGLTRPGPRYACNEGRRDREVKPEGTGKHAQREQSSVQCAPFPPCCLAHDLFLSWDTRCRVFTHATAGWRALCFNGAPFHYNCQLGAGTRPAGFASGIKTAMREGTTAWDDAGCKRLFEKRLSEICGRLDHRASALHLKSDPSKPGTKHLGWQPLRRGDGRRLQRQCPLGLAIFWFRTRATGCCLPPPSRNGRSKCASLKAGLAAKSRRAH